MSPFFSALPLVPVFTSPTYQPKIFAAERLYGSVVEGFSVHHVRSNVTIPFDPWRQLLDRFFMGATSASGGVAGFQRIQPSVFLCGGDGGDTVSQVLTYFCLRCTRQ
jgi:hypothetical protein